MMQPNHTHRGANICMFIKDQRSTWHKNALHALDIKSHIDNKSMYIQPWDMGRYNYAS